MARTSLVEQTLTMSKHTPADRWQQVPAKRISDRAPHVSKGLMNPNMKTRRAKEDCTRQVRKLKE